MIDFKINGRSLDLPPDFVLSLTRKSPVFFGGNMDSIPGAYTVPATIFANPHNRAILKAPELLNKWNDDLQIDGVRLHIDGNFLMEGKLYVSIADPDNYSIQFVSSAGSLNHLKERTIKYYNYVANQETFNVAQEFGTWQNMFDTIQGNPGDYPFMIYHCYFNDFNGREDALSFYVEYILGIIFKGEGYELETNVFNSPEMRSLLLFEDYVLNEEYFNGLFGQFYTVVPKEYFPNMYVATFLKSFCKNFALGLDIDSLRKKARLFDHNDLVDAVNKDWTEALRSTIQKKIKGNTFKIKSLSYDLTDNRYKRDFKYNELTPVVTDAQLPMTANNGDVCYVQSRASYIPWKDGTWDFNDVFQSLRPEELNTKGNEIKSNISTLYMTRDLSGALHPTAPGEPKRFVLSLTIPDNTIKENAHFMFYRGTINDNSNNSYALIHHDIHDHAGNEIGQQSLKWYGENGLYEKKWKPWINFLEGAIECTATMQPSMKDIFNFDFLEKVKLWDDHSGGYHYFFWKEFKLVVDMQQIRESKQTLVQVRQ